MKTLQASHTHRAHGSNKDNKQGVAEAALWVFPLDTASPSPSHNLYMIKMCLETSQGRASVVKAAYESTFPFSESHTALQL